MSPDQAERARRRIEWVWIGGLGLSEAAVIFAAAVGAPTHPLMVLCAGFGVALIVFEATIHLLAHWWFG